VREGLAASGWECVYANDIDPKKQEMYQGRFGKSDHFHLGDIWKTEEVIERIPGRSPLMTASFPCTDLSLAGHYRGLEGEQSSTFFGFAKVLEAMEGRRPPLIMIENVNGFLSSNKGKDFATAAQCLAELGYWLDVLVLDACHFTPQSRPRVFVIGVSDEYKPPLNVEPSDGWLWPAEKAGPLRPDPVIQFKHRLELPTGWLTLPVPNPPENTTPLSALIDIDDAQEWWEEAEVQRHCEMMSGLHRRKVDEIRSSKKRWVGTIFRRIRQKKMRAEVRFDGLAGCLRTPKGGSARQIVIVTDNRKLRMRWMNPREYARLQGAPDFPLVGTPIQQLWGFADAVCVPAVAWIDQCVLTPLYESISQFGSNGHARQSHT
jgi:DNA (cytosine-5)-methyltransferase 1